MLRSLLARLRRRQRGPRERVRDYAPAGAAVYLGTMGEVEVEEALKPLLPLSAASPLLVVLIGRTWRGRVVVREGKIVAAELEGVDEGSALRKIRRARGPALVMAFPARALQQSSGSGDLPSSP